jgi:dTDP-4-amino-4,6-dideoxygalactose transaminase
VDENQIESLITKKTKAIIPVHYAGVACDMDKIMEIAEKYQLFVIEDAAQAIDNYYTGKNGIKRPLGSIGHLAAFSFHETKNVISGEGGMLVINDESFNDRAEIIWEKGTNRSAFFKGQVDKYGWVDIGSSFLPSEIIAAFLWAQLENIEFIQNLRKEIWINYYKGLDEWAKNQDVKLPTIPDYSSNNAHMFYILCNSTKQRDFIINSLKIKDIQTVFHYQSLHSSVFYHQQHDGRVLYNSDKFSNVLLRLPFYIGIDINYVIHQFNNL